MGFSRVLIANRGEIALRIMRSLRTLGIGASIIHGREDRTSLPVRWSDSAVRVYRDDPLSSYLDVEAVVDAAKMLELMQSTQDMAFLRKIPICPEDLLKKESPSSALPQKSSNFLEIRYRPVLR